MDDNFNSQVQSQTQTQSQTQAQMPLEYYRFTYSAAEISAKNAKTKKQLVYKSIIFSILFLLLGVTAKFSVYINGVAANLKYGGIVNGFFIGTAVMIIVYMFVNLRAFNNACGKTLPHVCSSVYEYRFFADYLTLTVSKADSGEITYYVKRSYSDIERVTVDGEWIDFIMNGSLHMLRRNEINPNSVIYRIAPTQKKAAVQADSGETKWYRIVSITLMVASIMLIYAEPIINLKISGGASKTSWLYLIFSVFPIASAVIGFIMKSKGMKGYLGNIIIGILIGIFMIASGCFSLLF